MRTLVFKRVIEAVLTLLIATFLVYSLIYFSPSDPITLLLEHPGEVALNREVLENKIQEQREKYGLDKSMFTQYTTWLKNILQGDFGRSLLTNQKVSDDIIRRLPNSILLSIISISIQFVLSMFLGVISVIYFSKFWDHIIRIITVIIKSFPAFAVSLVVLSIFATKLYIYEISSSSDISRIWLPAITAGLIVVPKLTRMIRANLLDEMGKIYISSAVAKGLSTAHIIKHALLNSFIPILTILALSFASNMGGMIIIESIFSWPGVGKYGMDAVIRQDYPAVQGYTLTVIFLVIIINLSTDIATIMLQPSLDKRGENNETK